MYFYSQCRHDLVDIPLELAPSRPCTATWLVFEHCFNTSFLTLSIIVVQSKAAKKKEEAAARAADKAARKAEDRELEKRARSLTSFMNLLRNAQEV